MGRLMTFQCGDCDFNKTFFSGSGRLDFDIEKQKELFNCPQCGCLSLRTVKCEYNEEEGAYIPQVEKKQKCRKCKSLMVWAEGSEKLTCPNCHGTNCKYFMSGLWD